jgi:hypothetical protein
VLLRLLITQKALRAGGSHSVPVVNITKTPSATCKLHRSVKTPYDNKNVLTVKNSSVQNFYCGNINRHKIVKIIPIPTAIQFTDQEICSHNKKIQFLPYGKSIGSWIYLTHKTHIRIQHQWRLAILNKFSVLIYAVCHILPSFISYQGCVVHRWVFGVP